MVQEQGVKIEWTPVTKKDKGWYINIKIKHLHVFHFRIDSLTNQFRNTSES